MTSGRDTSVKRGAAGRAASKGFGESLLVAATEKDRRDARRFEHAWKGLVHHAVAGELARYKPRMRPGNRLDEVAALGPDPCREPERETVGGEPPGFLDVAAARDQRVRRPDRIGAARERSVELGLRRTDGKATAQSRHSPGELEVI